MTTRRTSTLLVLAAAGANVAFAGLGATFDYPDVLGAPATAVLASFRDHQVAVSLWFALLLLAAALLAPVAVGVARQVADRWATRIVGLGVAAAAVQVVGLSRWLLVVPTLAWQADDPARAADAAQAFESVGFALGTVIGETFGYVLTAAWTVAVVLAMSATSPSASARATRATTAFRAFRALGLTAAALIAAGVLVPFDVPGADLANFVGYVVWSGWLVWLAVRLWPRTQKAGSPRAPISATM